MAYLVVFISSCCTLILELDAKVLVPGHGPVTDASGVRDVQRYLRYVRDEAAQRFEAGMDAQAAAEDIDIADFRDWGDPERTARAFPGPGSGNGWTSPHPIRSSW